MSKHEKLNGVSDMEKFLGKRGFLHDDIKLSAMRTQIGVIEK